MSTPQPRRTPLFDYVLSRDGLPARQVGIWSAEKLTVVGRYMGIVTNGMSGKWEGLTQCGS